MEPRRVRRAHAVRITERDRELLGFIARHRLVHAGHVASLLGVTPKRAGDILSRLAGGGYVQRQWVFDRRPPCYRIKRRGLDVAGVALPVPGLDLSSYEHDVGVAWLWLAARDGVFGPLREILAERQLRSHDEAPDRSEAPLAVRLGGVGRGGRERLHYPDLLLLGPGGRRIAVELELTPKSRTRLERILGGYGADPRIDAVLYLVPNRNLGRSVIAAAGRLGLASRVHVQLVHHAGERAGAGAAPAAERRLALSR